MALFPGLPGWASTRKVKPIWILLKQETVSGSGISWHICKSAPRCIQITMPAPHRSVSQSWIVCLNVLTEKYVIWSRNGKGLTVSAIVKWRYGEGLLAADGKRKEVFCDVATVTGTIVVYKHSLCGELRYWNLLWWNEQWCACTHLLFKYICVDDKWRTSDGVAEGC